MKKILIFMLLLVFAVSLTSCNKNAPTEGLVYKKQSDGINYVTGIGEAVNKKHIVIPASYDGKTVTGIAATAFKDCTKIETITIPKTVQKIDVSAFYDCVNLESITVDSANATFKSIDGNLYTKDGKTLLYYVKAKTDSDFIVPNDVTTIASGAFNECVNLANVKLPDSLTTIEDRAFEGCKSIETVEFGANLVSIGDYAFAGCTALSSINIPDSTSIIGADAFFNCEAAKELIIGKSVTSIGDAAFAHCVSLESIVIRSESINTFGSENQVFMNAGKSAYGIDVTFAAGVKYIPAYLFATLPENAPNIETVTIEDASVCKTIGASSFKYCNKIKTLTVSSKSDFNKIQFIDTYSNPLNLNKGITFKEISKK